MTLGVVVLEVKLARAARAGLSKRGRTEGADAGLPGQETASTKSRVREGLVADVRVRE